MHRAVERIHHAIDRKEGIAIFGDYDCDGITAVSQLQRFFARRGVKPVLRLPHRVRDGYGLSASITEELKDAGITLLITADTGSTAVEEIAKLNEYGIDTIVTDHHQLRDELPPAYAIIHPIVSKHPAPHPSGAGVVYTLLCALEGGPWEGQDTDTALAMIGTVADLVPLRGENRALTLLGLQALNRIADEPLAHLRDRCRNGNAPLTARDVAFRIAPRINAAGRIEEPDTALRALLEGGAYLEQLDALNESRQRQTRTLMDEALASIDEHNIPPIISMVSDTFPHGIVGLLAGRLTEQFGRPSLIAHTNGNECTASLRSPPCYNIAQGLSRCSDHLLSFGGHAQAAGCRFAHHTFPSLVEALTADIEEHIDTDQLVPTLDIDAEISAGNITLQFCDALTALEPFGQGNAQPRFLLRSVHLDNARTCGKESTHLQARIGGIKCIGFGLGAFASHTEKLDIVATISIDEWNGNKQPQLVVEDISLSAIAHEKKFEKLKN